MDKVFENFIGGLTIGEDQIFGQLTIKPIFVDTDFHLPFLTLEEALEQDFLEITEKHEGGSVPELFVKNNGIKDVIILEGEELRGAKQNRIVNTTIVISAGSEIVIPVSCVERGRWAYVSNRFSSGESVLYPSLRKKSHSSVTKSLRLNRSHHSDQSEIWADITSKSARMSVASDTEAMSDILFAKVSSDTETGLLEEIKCQPRQIGFLAFINGGFAGGDIFGSAELCGKQMRKLLRGYYLDALDTGIKFPKLKAEEILSRISIARHEQFETVGKGSEIRFRADNLQGAWKIVDDSISHLTVFPGDFENKTCLEPVVSRFSRILILGTFPGEESLNRHQYYANPQNQFWEIMDRLLGQISDLPYTERINRLNEHDIALWDVIKECGREGSLDADIDENTIVPNDFQEFFDQYPNIKTVFFNGKSRKSAYRLFERNVLPQLSSETRARLTFVPLPSSSSNNARGIVEKVNEWQRILVH